jgi:hypothetical protein
MSAARPHPEFLELAAAGLDGLLGPAEQARLVAHLARCDVCRARVAGYEDDRLALRKLRAASPPPPRDLWARTSAALDRETGSGVPAVRPAATTPRRWIPLRSARGAYAAALAALLIVAVVGSGLVPGLIGPGASFVATATPIAVEPGVIAYLSTRDGNVGVYMGRIDSVCPEGFVANCEPIERDVRKVASFSPDFVAQQLSVSPDGRDAAVVGTSASGGGVYAVKFPELPESNPGPTPSSAGSTPTPRGSSKPTSPTETVRPTVTVLPSASGHPEAIIDHVAVVGEPPAYSADGTLLAFSAMPTDASAGPDIYVWRVSDQKIDRLTDDGGSIFASWVGQDLVGSRARPSKEDPAAAAPTSFVIDPATGKERLLARPAWRPIVDPNGRDVIYWDGTLASAADGRLWQEQHGGLYLAPWSLFDPNAAPVETPTPSPVPTPTAEPTPTGPPHGQASQAGQGPSPTAAPSAAAGSSSPVAQLSTDPPTSAPTTAATASPTARPTVASQSPAAQDSASPSPTAAPRDAPVSLFADRDYEADPILAWEVRWSPDGEAFGAWVGSTRGGARADDGTLTVGAISASTGRIDPERYQLKGAPAVRGFALGDHRIAWATVAGTDDKTEVRVLVWTDRGRGLLRTTPGGNDAFPAL